MHQQRASKTFFFKIILSVDLSCSFLCEHLLESKEHLLSNERHHMRSARVNC